MKSKILSLVLAVFVVLSLISLASGMTINSVSTNPERINPGQRVTVYIEIENKLNSDVQDVSLKLELEETPFSPYQSSSEVSFDEIEEDEDKEARFELIADSEAESGAYKIPVKISYKINNEDKETSGLISLIINANPEIEVFSEDSILIKGKNTELAVKIVNSGLGSAKLLSLELEPVSGIKILGNSNIYVGDIDSDDFDTVSFKISINENAPSVIHQPVKIKYRDSRNSNIEENKNLELKLYTEKQAQQIGLIKKNNTGIITGGVITIIVLYIIYRKIKNAGKRKKLEREK